MPNVPITDIKVHHKDLVVATQGRAIWILDNVTALHQIDAADDDLRRRSSSSRATAIARAMAPTCSGRMIDYYLPAIPSGPDRDRHPRPAGALVVNSYSSDAPVGGGRAADAAAVRGRAGRAIQTIRTPRRQPGAARGGSNSRASRSSKGMNRFVWDVRNQAGVALPPGGYQVRLKAATMRSHAAVHRPDRSERRRGRRDGGGPARSSSSTTSGCAASSSPRCNQTARRRCAKRQARLLVGAARDARRPSSSTRSPRSS